MGFNLYKQEYRHQTDEELMDMVTRHNDEIAFEEIYDRYCKKLIWFSMRITGNKEQAEDIVQDTFMRIVDRPQAFDRTQRFSTWVYTIVSNASLNVIRNENNRSRLLEENYVQINTTHLNHTIDSNLLKKKINALYNELNEKEKSIFVLRFENEISIKEIASILNIPEGSVKSCLFYLLKKISQQLQSYQVNN